jgi:hypothetical protein
MSLAHRARRAVIGDSIRRGQELESVDETNASGNDYKAPDENNSFNPLDGSSKKIKYGRGEPVHTGRFCLPSVEAGIHSGEESQAVAFTVEPGKVSNGDEGIERVSVINALKRRSLETVTSDSTDLSERASRTNSDDSMSSVQQSNDATSTMPQALLQCMGETVTCHGMGKSESDISGYASSTTDHHLLRASDELTRDKNSDGSTDGHALEVGKTEAFRSNAAEAGATSKRKKPRLVYKTCRDNRLRVNDASRHRTIPEKPITYFCILGQEKLFEITILSIDCSIILGQIQLGIKAETATTMSEVRNRITPKVATKLDAEDKWEFYMPESGALLKQELEPLVSLVQYMDECTFGRQLLVRVVAVHGPAVIKLHNESA